MNPKKRSDRYKRNESERSRKGQHTVFRAPKPSG